MEENFSELRMQLKSHVVTIFQDIYEWYTWKKKGKENIFVKNDKFLKKSKYCIGSIMFNGRI